MKLPRNIEEMPESSPKERALKLIAALDHEGNGKILHGALKVALIAKANSLETEPFEKRAIVLPNGSEIKKDKKGQWYVDVVHCLFCDCITIAPGANYFECGCGQEYYPVVKAIPIGRPIEIIKLKAE